MPGGSRGGLGARGLRGLWWTAALLLAASGVAIAAADDAGEPVRLEYRAAGECPDEAAFVARVRARTARARFVGAGEGEKARTFKVELTAGVHPSGSVTVMNGLRSEGTRHLDADSCADVADALALMVALAVDPHALSAAPPPTDAAPPEALDAGSAPDSEAALVADAESPDTSAPSLPPPPTTPSPADSVATTPAAAPRPLHYFGGGDFAVLTNIAPNVIFAGAPYVGWRSTGDALLGLNVHVAFLRAGTAPETVTDGSADFTLTLGRVDTCAMLWPSRSLRLGGCARIEAGVLEGSGYDVANAQTQPSAWLSLGPLARFEWSFFGPLMLDLGAGPAFHITANHFYFNPEGQSSSSGWTVPIVGFSGEAGLGVHVL
ncbi:MAG: hypothetical protein ACLQVI_07145 [Polyangiaceae bacterium]